MPLSNMPPRLGEQGINIGISPTEGPKDLFVWLSLAFRKGFDFPERFLHKGIEAFKEEVVFLRPFCLRPKFVHNVVHSRERSRLGLSDK